ncbi:SNARE associated Golgi protein [Bifidobacterium ramosum]|uniref:DedA family protein n=1 Tax=Bifidobacterium ramosum TaxID=1798158 RepID=A0A6L4X232_9BIFI|nr:DedA family protein [Bifidobacterium ramosum]KAB8288818.1 SNARE associated Golgi protein [Bifidobacterium ramosum]NEG71318.1 DedA family protein [Bifidobacterium ramosum]
MITTTLANATVLTAAQPLAQNVAAPGAATAITSCPVSTGGFIGAITDWLVGLMSTMGWLGTGVAVFLENLFPPIPSEVILPLAGFTAAQGRMTLFEAIGGATLGSVVGALVLYGIAYAIGADRMRRLFDAMPLTDATDIDKANDWFARYGLWSVLIGRVIPIVRSLISIPAGIARTNLLRFTLLTAFGSLVWNTILVMAGYLLGSQWCGILGVLDRFQYAVAAVIVVLFVWYVVVKVRARMAAAR